MIKMNKSRLYGHVMRIEDNYLIKSGTKQNEKERDGEEGPGYDGWQHKQPPGGKEIQLQLCIKNGKGQNSYRM